MNSVGCVLGALSTGFFFIPSLGSEATLILFGTLALAAGVLVALAHDRGWRRAGLAAAGLALVLVWSSRPAWDRLQLTSGGHVYFRPAFVGPATRLLFFQEDTLGGITTVVDNPRGAGAGFARTLLSNGKFQASDSGERLAQTGFALVPILHAAGRDDALVIGLGSGQTAAVVSEMDFRRVDVAEIAPGIVEAAGEYFRQVNGSVLERPDVKVHLEDGRNHLLLNDGTYDLITIELTSVWFAGATSLYSREFFELTKKRLKPGGVLQQWIQVHHIGMSEIGSIVATMRLVYPHVSFWLVGGQGVLVASVEPQRLQPASLQAAVRKNPWREASPRAAADRLVSLLSSRLLSPADVDRLLAARAFRVNTDANRYLEYATPRYNLDPRPLDAMNLNSLALFAGFEAQKMEPGPVSELSDLLKQVTPERQRDVLGLRQPAPGSP
jgi:spermidine synthase